MPILGLMIAGLALSAASTAINAQGSVKAGKQADYAGALRAGQRESQGVREIGALRQRMALSGVEATGDTRGGGVTLTDPKAGFFGIGSKDGSLTYNRDYSGEVDTSSLLLATSEDAIALDAEIIRRNAEYLGDSYRREAVNYGIQGTGQLIQGGIDMYDYIENLP